MKEGPLNFGNSTIMKLGNSSCCDFPLEQIISMTFPTVGPTIELPKLYKTLIVVVRRTLADLHTYNVRMRPPAVSADEVVGMDSLALCCYFCNWEISVCEEELRFVVFPLLSMCWKGE